MATVQELERLYGQGRVSELRRIANQGNVEATRQLASWGLVASQFTLGNWYTRGANGLAVDYEQAIHWYKEAAEQGDAEAMYLLGDFAKHGLIVPGSTNGAVGWYEKAANLGYPMAKIWLGIHYCEGDGIRHNPALGRKLIEQGELSVQEIDAPTNMRLGALFCNSCMYADGENITSYEDYIKSIRYFEHAVLGYRKLGPAFSELLEQAQKFLAEIKENKNRIYDDGVNKPQAFEGDSDIRNNHSIVGDWEFRRDLPAIKYNPVTGIQRPAVSYFLRFSFLADGSYIGSNSDGARMSGNYIISGNTIRLSNSGNTFRIEGNDTLVYINPNGEGVLNRV